MKCHAKVHKIQEQVGCIESSHDAWVAVCVELLAVVATVLLSHVKALSLVEFCLVVSIVLVAALVHGLGHAA